jgi:replicative DNA helicase
MNLKKISNKYINLNSLPNNFFAEQSILNILLTNPDLLEKIKEQLKINSFYFEAHKLIYQNLLDLIEINQPINLTNLFSHLQDKGLLKEIGGIEYIASILNKFENSLDLENYINLVNEKYLRRLLIDLGKQIINWGYTTSENLEKILEKIENALFNLNEENSSQKIYTAAEIIDEVFNELQNKLEKNQTVGLETSFKDLDSIIQGFQKSDLIIIAGRPSMGKTAFALNLARNIVLKYNVPLLIFSLEMSRQQIIYRFLATEANINSNRLKSGKMNTLEWKTLTISMEKISELPIYIDDNPNLTISDIQTRLKKVFKKNNNGLIIIDYLQLMKVNLKLENRVQEISYITRNLKILAKEFNIPILLLSQLSRNVESRINKRPMLSDLRESGCSAKITKKVEKNLIIWNKNNFLITSNFKKYNFKGIKPIFLLKFDLLKNTYLTANHKILSKNGWIKISELNIGTKIYFKNKNSFLFPNFLKNLEYFGLEAVYDRTIPFFHNYIKNNIILHNSIEQDADIVIMLYREDYYNEKTLQPHITEFILAKHRNGPVGTAKLLFNPNTTTFNNL